MTAWIAGPHRTNDRSFTRAVLAAAVNADLRTPTTALLARSSLALASVEVLHGDAPEWDEWRTADRRWVALDVALCQPVPWSMLRQLRGNLQHSLAALQGRLDLADHVELLAEEALTGGGAR